MRTTLTLRNGDAGHRATKVWTVHIVADEATQDKNPKTLCGHYGTMANVVSVQGGHVPCKRCEKVFTRRYGYGPGLFESRREKA